jgi:hypothetical protein
MNLADLVADLPPRVHRVTEATTRKTRREIERAPYSDEVHEQWLRDLDREAEARDTLPNVRAARVLKDEELERAILADLIHELNRTVKENVTVVSSDSLPPVRATRGPAPATNEGLRATLRSYLDARESCDRFDSLIRHAATALLLAEAVAEGRA